MPIPTRAGVGIVNIDRGGGNAAETLRSALAAAQDSRRTLEGFAHYDRRSDEAHVRAFTLLRDLDLALRHDEGLSIAYQPRIDLASGAVAGAEALIRWNHPAFGPVSPVEFIPLAETTTLISGVTRWMLKRACAQAASWRASGLKLKTSINVSPADLRGRGLVETVRDVFTDLSVEPEWIEFEFTEGVMTGVEPFVTETIEAFRAMGVTIAIDDFGTGYSNLDYLTRVPADTLKLDRSFVQPLAHDGRRRKLVRSMIDLAHDLGFRVVAEGIETADVSDLLTGWRCDEGQGFLFSRPVGPEAFGALVAGKGR